MVAVSVMTQTPVFLSEQEEIERNDGLYQTLHMLSAKVIELTQLLQPFAYKLTPQHVHKESQWQTKFYKLFK